MPRLGLSASTLMSIAIKLLLSFLSLAYLTDAAILTQPHTSWALARISSNNDNPLSRVLSGGLQRRLKPGETPLSRVFRYKYDEDALGQGVTVYVLDQGVSCKHIDFGGRAKCPQAGDLTAHWISRLNAWAKPKALDHGTAVAGVVASNTWGVAKRANIVSVKVVKDDRSVKASLVIQGLMYAASKERKKGPESDSRAIITMSIQLRREAAVRMAIEAVSSQHQIVVTSAAGNTGQDACAFDPTRMADVVVSGGSDIADEMYGMSNYGSCISVIAPAVDCLSTAWREDDTAFDLAAGYTGTAMASAYTAGTIANMLSRPVFAHYGPDLLKSIIIRRAQRGAIRNIPHGTPNRVLMSIIKPSTSETASAQSASSRASSSNQQNRIS
ncbi:hypothetical protein PYCC9005_001138 [Savitreella phatthalungensis]